MVDFVRKTGGRKRYARGKHALGQCPRCGFEYNLSNFRYEAYTKMRVCRSCWDPTHPQETVVAVADAQALRHPSPRLDTEGGPIPEEDRREFPTDDDFN